MATTTPVVLDSTKAIAPFSDELVHATKTFIVEARSERTREAYKRAWRSFEAWCSAHGICALPASPETVAAWLSALATGIGHAHPLARSSINQALSAVLLAHRTAGVPLDRKHPVIAETWRGISRVKARSETVRKARPVLGADLSSMLDGFGNRPIDVRDRALLAIGWAGALRRSELVGLDWMRKGDGQGYVTLDDQAVTITLATSKASQDEAETVVLPRADMRTAAEALIAWIDVASVPVGQPIFRPVDQHGHIGASRLTDHSVSRIIKARVRDYARKRGNGKAAAKDLAAAFSGHSLRAGFATTAARNKIPSYDIRNHTRHKSVQTVEGYIREAEKLTNSILKAIGF
jgi:integrase